MATQEVVEIRGLRNIIRRVLQIEGAIGSPFLMGEIAEFIKFTIKARTSEGRDVEGSLFEPYSDTYALFRQETGHSTDRVNLTYHGTMLASMTSDVSEDEARIYFLNTPDEDNPKVTSPQKAYFLNEERLFFALSQAEVDEIVDMVRDYIRRSRN